MRFLALYAILRGVEQVSVLVNIDRHSLEQLVNSIDIDPFFS